jgi:hypothetical protein
MFPIVPPATRNLILLHVFKDLEPNEATRRGYSKFGRHLSQLTLRTCRKTFSHYGHLSLPN